MCYWHPCRADASPHLSKAKSKLHESGQRNADKECHGATQTNKRQAESLTHENKKIFVFDEHQNSWEKLLIERWREFIDA